MKQEKRTIQKHLFICCNIKEHGESTDRSDSELLVKNLKHRLKENHLWNDIKVSKSGCLGCCTTEIAATLYPDNILFTEISLEDEDILYNILTS